MSATEDLHPDLQDILSDFASENQTTVDRLVAQIDALYDIDLREIDGDDAEKFAESFHSDDVDGIVEVMEKYDVPDEQIEAFTEFVSDEEDTEPEKNGDSPNTSENGSGGGLTDAQKQEVQRIVSESVPSSEDIANDLKSQLGGGGQPSGGGGQPQQPQGGGGNRQQQIFLELIADQLKGDSGGGAMSEMGEQATQQVMKRSMQRLAKPSFGERIGDAIEQQLSEQVAENVAGDIELDGMGMGVESDSEDDSDDEDSSGVGWL